MIIVGVEQHIMNLVFDALIDGYFLADFLSELLFDLALQRFIRSLGQFDMPANRQPTSNLLVMYKSDLSVADDEGRHDEVKLFMQVWHCAFL